MSDKHLWNEYVRLEAEVKQLRASIDAAVAAEREACAKLCEENCAGYQYGKLGSKPVLSPFDKECGGRHEGMTYAAAIRARGEQAKDE